MARHLGEIATTVAPGDHAALLLDLAGWHTTRKRAARDTLTPLSLPARSPKIDPVENLCQWAMGADR